jgi:hypothetical protein
MTSATGTATGRAYNYGGTQSINAEGSSTWPSNHAENGVIVKLQSQRPGSTRWRTQSTQSGLSFNSNTVYAGNGILGNVACYGYSSDTKWRAHVKGYAKDSTGTVVHTTLFVGVGQKLCT